MSLTTDGLDHGHYSGLTLLPDILRRYDYAMDTLSASQFVRLLSADEVIALADETCDEGAIDARRAADFMWDERPPKVRYALADGLHAAALVRLDTI